MQVRRLLVLPLLALGSTAMSIAVAPPALADCNSTGNSTLCATGGDVRGGSSYSPPPSAPYSPYPCVDYGDPMCLYYDNYDPGVIFDRPNWGIGIGGGPIDPGFSRPGIGGGGGIGPR